MDRYDVLSPIKLDGQRIPVGRSVVIDDDRAEELLAYGVIRPANGDLLGAEPAGKDSQADNMAAIIEAIGRLEPDNPDHWTKSGAPDARALGGVVGHEVSAAERDAAWDTWQMARATEE